MTLQTSLLEVDWSKLPEPPDDGAADHLEGAPVPGAPLAATDGRTVSLAGIEGRAVVFAYPLTGAPGRALPDRWDAIPGARGCTPQACAFRDLFAELRDAGARHVFGLSTQDSAYQREAVERLHLPFPMLSGANLEFARALNLPTMTAGGATLLKRLTMVIEAGRIVKVFYPVFPPDRNAADVVSWLRANAA